MTLQHGTLSRPSELSPTQKLRQVNWGLVVVLCLLAGMGTAMLYSAANGAMDPWAKRHLVRFSGGLAIVVMLALVDIRIWFRYAYWLYFVALALLVAVEFVGATGMGAQRWIDLKVIQLQPSEVMKVTLVLALARYFHGVAMEEIGRPTLLLLPLLMVVAPVALVLKQPDLGTALMLLMIGGVLFFLAGVRLWKFAVLLVGALAAIPVAWQLLHDYQRQRILTLLDPEVDPLGSGYHSAQAMIALGSGGAFGKGFLNGSQAHGGFLPEKQTDFIFTMLAEEWGMLGGLILLGLFTLVFIYGYYIALRSRSQFGRLLALGLTVNLFLYVFINIAMVMGLIPVVGVPLPLISYGGTAMLAVMIGLGLTISVYVHRDVPIPRRGLHED